MRGLKVPNGNFVEYGRFGRMFPNLWPAPDDKDVALMLGDSKGPLVGGGGWNFGIPAGFTYLGQFIDHDLTFDPTSSLEKQNDPQAIQNFRSAALALDAVYGAGPEVSPFFYDARDPNRMRLGPNKSDLPRIDSAGTPVIADPRNDENFIVAQLLVAFLNFHNYVVKREPQHAIGIFERAQRIVRWHYQWIIRHEYLPKIVDPEVIKEFEKFGCRLFRWSGDHPFMPVEFSLAAFRFGHSQIREEYDIRPGVDGSSVTLQNLFGRHSIKKLGEIDWGLFFPFPGRECQFSRPIGFRLVRPLMDLPKVATGDGRKDSARHLGSDESPKSLAYLDVRRGQAFALPAGTAVAKQIASHVDLPKDKVLHPQQVWNPINEILLQQDKPRIPEDTSVPLWLYILMEAQLFHSGAHLGPVGSWIVAEVIMGLLRADTESYLSQESWWTPTLPSAVPGKFSITDLLRLAMEEQATKD